MLKKEKKVQQQQAPEHHGHCAQCEQLCRQIVGKKRSQVCDLIVNTTRRVFEGKGRRWGVVA
jgi:hypothetical protein